MTCTEEYKEHIEYTFHAFCKIVIRNASYTALRTWSRKHKREISLDYITDEKHYPLGTTDEYFKAPEPDEEYIVHLCGDTVTVILYFGIHFIWSHGKRHYSKDKNSSPSMLRMSSIGIFVPSCMVIRRSKSSTFMTAPVAVTYAPPALRSSGLK